MTMRPQPLAHLGRRRPRPASAPLTCIRLRVPHRMAKRADALCDFARRAHELAGARNVTRSDVLRVAVGRGLECLEIEYERLVDAELAREAQRRLADADGLERTPWAHSRPGAPRVGHRVELTGAAQQDWHDLPPDARRRVAPHVDGLAHVPRPQAARPLLGAPRGRYRLAVGDWRVTYDIGDADRLITVTEIAHREQVYRRIEQRTAPRE